MSYEPTEEQIENLKIKEEEFTLSGDGVFHTIQGEGDLVGLPTTFVRLHHCNLNCSWCDTPYAWDKKDPRFYEEPTNIPIDDLMEEVIKEQTAKGSEEFIPNIVFTGGEPLMQQEQIMKFIKEYPNLNYQIETNGTIMPSSEIIDFAWKGGLKFNCSPKLPNAGMDMKRTVKPEVLRILNTFPNTIFKFVSIDEKDIEDIEKYFTEYIDKKKIMIMPEGLTDKANAEHLKQMVDIILRKGYRITPRLQNTLFQNRRRF